jgi:hypothetical protein
MITELGGKHFAKGVILSWLVNTGGSNFKLLEAPPEVIVAFAGRHDAGESSQAGWGCV